MKRSAVSDHPKENSSRGASGIGAKRSRIGVLPFLSDHESQAEDFAVSISEAIAGELARYSSCVVVPPRYSTDCAVISPTPNEENPAADLDYILEGAVLRDSGGTQVTVRLLDVAECARTVWSERAPISRANLPRLGRLMASRIVRGIDPVTLFFDGRLRKRNRDGATGLLLSAIRLMSTLERRKYEEAGRLIDRAYDIEPENALVLAWAAFWQVVYFGQGWTDNLFKASAIAQDRARRAISLKPDDAETLAICGHVNSFLVRDYDAALHYFDRAERLDPTLEFPWLWGALTYCYAGKPGLALERVHKYRSLISMNPLNPWTHNICSVAYMFSGNYEKAVELSRPMTKVAPNFVNGYKPLIASLGHLGRIEEAKPYVGKLLALEPNFSLERFAKVYPIKYESDREHYVRGLRLAGIPER